MGVFPIRMRPGLTGHGNGGNFWSCATKILATGTGELGIVGESSRGVHGCLIGFYGVLMWFTKFLSGWCSVSTVSMGFLQGL